MNTKALAAWSTLGFLCLSQPLGAGEQYVYGSDGYIGLRVGHIELAHVDDQGSYNVGITAGRLVWTGWSVDAAVDYQWANLWIPIENEYGEPFTVVPLPLERKTWALQLGVSYTPFADQPVRPYAQAGVGYYFSHYTSDYSSSETIGDEGYFAGLGLEMFGGGWRGNGSLNLETRWLFTEKEPFADEQIRADGLSVSVGYKWKF